MHVKVGGNKVILLTQLTLKAIEDLPSIHYYKVFFSNWSALKYD